MPPESLLQSPRVCPAEEKERRVLTLENFTTLPEGAVSFEGLISTCPRCGRTGIERPTELGGRICLHVQATEIVGDGIVTETIESCPLSEALPFDLLGEGVI